MFEMIWKHKKNEKSVNVSVKKEKKNAQTLMRSAQTTQAKKKKNNEWMRRNAMQEQKKKKLKPMK